mmetsp:Transcript_147530/g.257954  ORF Transcript_147530/g.257954 Transcript_147530/m.257954 type:complete len:255 (-) Transcript_147530:85-849(-)
MTTVNSSIPYCMLRVMVYDTNSSSYFFHRAPRPVLRKPSSISFRVKDPFPSVSKLLNRASISATVRRRAVLRMSAAPPGPSWLYCAMMSVTWPGCNSGHRYCSSVGKVTTGLASLACSSCIRSTSRCPRAMSAVFAEPGSKMSPQNDRQSCRGAEPFPSGAIHWNPTCSSWYSDLRMKDSIRFRSSWSTNEAVNSTGTVPFSVAAVMFLLLTSSFLRASRHVGSSTAFLLMSMDSNWGIWCITSISRPISWQVM